MKVAVTGATGFLGRYIVRELLSSGCEVKAWKREGSDISDLGGKIEWIYGELNSSEESSSELLADTDCVVHAALYRPGKSFRGEEGEIVNFLEKNLIGTIRLIEAARDQNVGKFIFISTCAVHEKILEDRELDEAHPLWPKSHYGAHKAAIEKFIHSYGLGMGYPICSLRPTGIYGIAHPPGESKWYEIVRAIACGETVVCSKGGKEVHVSDVAKAVKLLIDTPSEKLIGEAFNCYDQYISEWDIATITKRLTNSNATITGEQTQPKHQISTKKLEALGMKFRGAPLLENTIEALLRII